MDRMHIETPSPSPPPPLPNRQNYRRPKSALNRESYMRMMNSFQRKHNLQSHMLKNILLGVTAIVAIFVMAILFTVIYVRYWTIRELSEQYSCTTTKTTVVANVTRMPDQLIIINSSTINIVENVSITSNYVNNNSSKLSPRRGFTDAAINGKVDAEQTESITAAADDGDETLYNDETSSLEKKKSLLVLSMTTMPTIPLSSTILPSPSTISSLTTTETIPTAIESDFVQNEYRKAFIKQMTKEAWDNYRKHAWGHETIEPVRNRRYNLYFGDATGYTIVSAISTLVVMGMDKEYEQGRRWIERDLEMHRFRKSSPVFLMVTGYLGGLLSSYALTKDGMFLGKAKEIADDMRSAYRDATGLSKESVNIEERHSTQNPNAYLLEVVSQMMEYNYLAHLTNNSDYEVRSKSIEKFLTTVNKTNGLYMDMLDVDSGRWSDESQLLGADSTFYSHLIKRFIQSSGSERKFMDLYTQAMNDLERNAMFAIDTKSARLYTRSYTLDYRPEDYEYMKFAGCQLGATLALGAKEMERELEKNRHKINNKNNLRKVNYQIAKLWQMAEEIGETCFHESNKTQTGLPPARFYYNINEQDLNLTYFWSVESDFKKHALNPELAESYFILWRLTRDPKYREYAWQLTRSIHAHCRTRNGGYSSIDDVNELPAKMTDYQSAHFISATLKYLYLTFSDDTQLPLDEWVFNEIGHPLPIIR